MKFITAEWLENVGACKSAVADFRKTFGESCPLDARNAALWIERFPNEHFDDFFWLVPRLMKSFDFETLEELEQRLVIEPEQGADFLERTYNAVETMLLLEDNRIAKAIEEIADHSTSLNAVTEAVLRTSETLLPRPEE